MIRKLTTFIIISLLSIKLHSQGLEVYGGYPNPIKSKNETQQINNWANGNVGFNLMLYVRSIGIQLGGGFMSDNYKIITSNYRGSVKHWYIYVPIMIHPRLYTDGKNTFSVGAGINFKITSNAKTSLVYSDGTSPQSYYGKYIHTVDARVSFKYSRLLLKSFLLFTELYADIRFKRYYDDYFKSHPFPTSTYIQPVRMPFYDSHAILGLNVGIGYLLPIDGKSSPRYFLKRQKKTKE